jgi:hypothetical protein
MRCAGTCASGPFTREPRCPRCGSARRER